MPSFLALSSLFVAKSNYLAILRNGPHPQTEDYLFFLIRSVLMMDPMYMDSMPLHMDHPLHGMGGGIGGGCDPHMNGLSLQEMIDTGILTGVRRNHQMYIKN